MRQLTEQLGSVEVRFTTGSGDGILQTQQAIDEGCEIIVSVGGDGTNNEVVNGFFLPDGQLRNKDALFAFFPSASGGDLRRSLPTANTVPQLIELLSSGETRLLDVGRISMQDAHNKTIQRFFLNVASLGISAMVNRYVSSSHKPFGGTVAFFWASLRSILRYRNPTVRISIDDGPSTSSVCHLVAIANGQYFGGGMKIAPHAELNDGYFDIVTLGDYNRLELLLQGTSVYRGTHINHPKTSVRKARKLHAESDTDIWLDIDGEVPGRLPACFEIMPQCLPFMSKSL
jgi:YegS/Rv2252/BmrU family lipid kinase